MLRYHSLCLDFSEATVNLCQVAGKCHVAYGENLEMSLDEYFRSGLDKFYFNEVRSLYSYGQGNSIMVSISVCQVGLSRFKLGTIHMFQKGGILSAFYQLVPTSADNWFTKGYVIMHVKDL